MGRLDILPKEYISDNARFADAVNAVIYNGEQVVKEDELVDVESELQNTRSNNKRRDVQKRRDVVKKIGNEVVYVIMAIELQDYIDYAMSLRVNLYEAMEYDRQKNEISKKHKKNKDLSGDELMSGFAKTDRVKPVIALILYFGESKWDGERKLKNILDLSKIDDKMELYINDYKLNLYDYHDYDSFDTFKSELGKVFGFLRNCSSKKELLGYIEKNKDMYTNIDIKTAELISRLRNYDVDFEESDITDRRDKTGCNAMT